MQKYFLLLLCTIGFGFNNLIQAQKPFITVWKADSNGEIAIPTNGPGYKYDIKWTNLDNVGQGDGSSSGETGDFVIIKLNKGDKYQVEISKDFPYFVSNNGIIGKPDMLLLITQWGDIVWGRFDFSFASCNNLDVTATDIPDLSKIKYTNYMFAGCENLKGTTANWKWKTSSIIDMSCMFCKGTLFNEDISSWDVSSVELMNDMFHDGYGFNQDLGIWDLSKIKDMTSMFDNSGMGCVNYGKTLTGWEANANTPSNITLSAVGVEYNTSGKTAHDNLISNLGWTIKDDGFNDFCGGFKTIWKASAGGDLMIYTNSSYSYKYDIAWKNLDNAGVGDGSSTNETGDYNITGLSSGDRYLVSITGLFPHFNNGVRDNSAKYKNLLLEISQWGDIEWEDFHSSFEGSSNMDLTAKDTPILAKVIFCSDMFRECKSLEGKSANWKWHTVYIKNMSAMFNSAYMFNADITGWDTKNVEDMSGMFSNTLKFNQNIGVWNTGNVKDMNGMFYNCIFNKPINDWDVSNVRHLGRMFADNKFFNQPLDKWNTINVMYCQGMFQHAGSFNQPLDKWNTKNVTTSKGMFDNATSFNQTLEDWNLASITDMEYMFDKSGMDCINYGRTIYGWANNGSAPSSITLGADGIKYSNAASSAVDYLVKTKSWTFKDGGVASDCWELWTGATSTDFANANNWKTGIVPLPLADIQFDNSASNNLELDQNRKVGSVDFNGSKKKIILGSYDLSVDKYFKSSGSNSYVRCDNAGVLTIDVKNNSSKLFPVGITTYTPVTIENKDQSSYYSVNLVGEVYFNGQSGTIVNTPHVKTTWNISKNNYGLVGLNPYTNFTFEWNAADESGSLLAPLLNHFNSIKKEWEMATAGSSMYSSKKLVHSNYNGSFSPFAIGNGPTPLPISLIYFEAVPDYAKKQVQLMWETSQEINNSHFDILRSVDGISWESIGSIKGSGNSYQTNDYSFYDYIPLEINYYRFLQVDIDGNSTLGPIRLAQFIDNRSYNLFPNPANHSLSIDSEQIGSTVTITDLSGRILHRSVVTSEHSTIDISTLATGLYFVKINDSVVKLIKE